MTAPFVLLSLSFGLAACSKDDGGDTGGPIVDQDFDGVAEGEDCDDLDAALGSQFEDADCDGTLTLEDCDDTDPALNEADLDGDGASTCAGDCDDEDSAVYPAAVEVCNGVDDDCDGLLDSDDDSVDATDLPDWYRDADQDGFGSEEDSISQCDQPAWYVLEQSEGFDCDDSDPDAYPGATEYCDGHDDNCDGEVDEDSAVDVLTWYSDSDGDGFGYLTDTDIDCYQPSGYVADNTDCDDSEITTYPGADEYCDGVNNDCDSDTDEDHALDATTDTWTNTLVSYCDVVLKNGATLYISGLVELSAYGTFSLDSSSEIIGDAAGEAAASGSGSGGYSSSGGGGGAGYGGAGGLGGYDSSDSPGSGGSAYGSSTSESILEGSGGGNSDRTSGGSGGAAIAIWADNISIAGLISMNGATGGGGRVKVFYDSSLSYPGGYDVSGGSGGTYGSAAHGANGVAGTETETSQAYP